MTEEQANKVIELLKGIKDNTESIKNELSSIYTQMPDDDLLSEKLNNITGLLRDLA
ncbi:MAG: hypothetical protein RIC95_09700 [Vicingaceae bacterium]